jgi:hypothetical protein
MRPAQLSRNRSPLLTLVVAAAVLLIFASPVLSYTWLGPFPDVPITVPVETPTMDETVPPIFEWTEPPPVTGLVDLTPPGSEVVPQSTPEPATVITGLIGAGALGLVRLWRKRRKPRPG